MGGSMEQFKTGINGWAFPPSMPIVEAASASAEAGFQAFEPTIGLEGAMTPNTPQDECHAAGEAIRGQGLDVVALASGMHWSTPFSDPDPATRQKAIDLTRASLERAAWIGAPCLLIVPAVVSHFREPERMRVGYSEAWRLSTESLHALIPYAEATGVVLALENVWNQFLTSPRDFRQFIDQFHTPWIKAYLDLGNVLRYGFPDDWIRELGPRIARVHLKDFKLSTGHVGGFCLPGLGDIRWSEVINALHKVGYRGPLTVEGREVPLEMHRQVDRILGDSLMHRDLS